MLFAGSSIQSIAQKKLVLQANFWQFLIKIINDCFGVFFGRTLDQKPNEDLMTYLRVQLAEAINLEDRSLSTQLHETMRCIKELPPNRYNTLAK